jgi:hypothetical protein
MSKVMYPHFTPRCPTDRVTEAGRVEGERQSVERKSDARQDGNITWLPGLGVPKADRVTAKVIWFQAHQFPFSKPRKR